MLNYWVEWWWLNVSNELLIPVVQEPQQIVSNVPGLFRKSEQSEKCIDVFDVVVCGGTLGIFIATALSSKGLRVGIVEKALLRGVLYFWH